MQFVRIGSAGRALSSAEQDVLSSQVGGRGQRQLATSSARPRFGEHGLARDLQRRMLSVRLTAS